MLRRIFRELSLAAEELGLGDWAWAGVILTAIFASALLVALMPIN